MRALKWVVFSTLGLFLTLVLALGGTVWWAAHNPKKAFAFAEKYLLPSDLLITWDKMDFKVERGSWRHWDVIWNTEKLKIIKGSPDVLVPVDHLDLKFTLRLFQGGPWLTLQELNLKGGPKAHFRSADEPPQESAGQSPFQQLQTYLGYLKTASGWVSINKMDIDIPIFALLAAKQTEGTNFKIKLAKPAGPDGSGATGYGVELVAGNTRLSAEGWLDAAKIGTGVQFLKLKLLVNGVDWRARTELDGVYRQDDATFTGGSDVIYGDGAKPIEAKPKINLTLTPKEAFLHVQSTVANVPGPVVKLDNLQAEVRVPFDNGVTFSERSSTFKVWTPVELFFVDKNMRRPLEDSCRCKIPEKMLLKLEGWAWLNAVTGQPAKRAKAVEAKLSIESVSNKLFTADVAAHLKIDKEKDTWIVEPRLDSKIVIQSYQGVRQFLDARNIMIPAPLDVLEGKIEINARGNVDRDDKIFKTMVEVKVDLASQTQKVAVESNINLEMARNFKGLDVYIHAMIRQIRLALPPIDPIRGMPSMTTDKRLLFAPPAKQKPSGFKLRVFFDVKTASPGSVQLLSKLAEPFIPVTIDINNANKGETAGSVRLEPFNLSYLRRKVHVERLQVTLAENEDGDFPIGARFRLDQTAYKIYVDIAGTVDAPIVNLNSDPFLPRADIISVLLFDRVNDELISTDADSAGGFQAALADRAIGLLGLWAFATTPIRSFTYNPVTKLYTATVQLADGLTAGVGTNWERAAHFEVRKRVSRRWVLTASWTPTEDQTQVGKLVLQWEKRF